MTPEQVEAVARANYIIRKGGAYYRPNAQGYTYVKAEAGRYTLEQAISYSHPNGPDGPRDGISYMLDDAAIPKPEAADLVEQLEALSDQDGEHGHHARSQTIAKAATLIRQQVARIAELEAIEQKLFDTGMGYCDKIDALAADNARLREALTPFAWLANLEDRSLDLDSAMVSVSLLRKARTALESAKP